MKKLFLSVSALLCALGMFAGDKKLDDKILMTVNGRDVKVSEFRYLFEKNNTQQLEPQSIDDYIGMFVDYKLKVADAEKAGIDTTAAFISEYDKFRKELAAPYLRDNTIEEALINESYSHLNREVNVSHIMIARGQVADPVALLDSISAAIRSGAVTFEDAAKKYSIDTPTATHGGLMGWLPAGRFPWPFEKAAYDTEVGQISPVIDSGYGYHIVKVNETRKSRGQVHAAHILKMTRDLPPELVADKKAAIDSIYNILKGGADFAAVAEAESEDPGSARMGGDLGWFGSGVMVAEFDSVAFATPDGAISDPFKTTFGYHIIKRVAHRDVEPFEEAREKIKAAMMRDGRAEEPRKARLAQLAEKYGKRYLKANFMGLKYRLSSASLDSATLAQVAVDNTPIFSVGDRDVTVASAYRALNQSKFPDGAILAESLLANAETLADDILTDLAIDDLVNDNDDYRNLVNEYRDGILLFEISNRNVWDRAAKDREGLEAFFHNNASRYAWDAPHFKGYVIFAANDSIVGEAVKFADGISADKSEDFVAQMRKQFGKNIKIERVIAAKGENAITDYLAFGGVKPEAKSSRWASYAAYKGRVIDAPEEAADVRGAVTTDYQSLLERQWLKKLHKSYPVKIDKKVLKSIKSEIK